MDELLSSTPRKYASRYFQLKVGHGAIGTFLANIGLIETPQTPAVQAKQNILSSTCTKHDELKLKKQLVSKS